MLMLVCALSLGARLLPGSGARRLATRAAVAAPPAPPVALRRVAATETARHWRSVARAAEAAALRGWFGERPCAADRECLDALVHGLALTERPDGELAQNAAARETSRALERALLDGDTRAASALLTSALDSSATAAEHLAAVCEGLSAAAVSAGAFGTLVRALALDGREQLRRCECFDISHLHGRATVGAYSVLRDGLAAVDEYGCIAIGMAPSADDPAAMREALSWRLGGSGGGGGGGGAHEAADERARPPGELPTLLLVDGGKPQLSAARRTLAAAGVAERGAHGVRVVALAKQEEKLFVAAADGGVDELQLPLDSPALSLFRRLRDEAHATAILSHRTLRHAAEFESVFDGLGVVVGTQRRLRERFGTADALLAATPAALRDAADGQLDDDAAGALARALAARAPRRAARLSHAPELLAGYESAVAAAVASSRRAGRAVTGWAAEARAARWWAQRRPHRLDALERRDGLVDRLASALCVLATGGLATGGTARAAMLDAELRGWAADAERRALESAARARALAHTTFKSSGSGGGGGGGDGDAGQEAAAQVVTASLDDSDVGLVPDEGPSAAAASPSALPAHAREWQGRRHASFELCAPYEPSGDQSAAIDALCTQLRAGAPRVALRGATGTGKTFAMASVIARLDRAALVLAPNKVLAAQLCAELRAFFPRNSVHYFASNFDYYRPEAFNAVSDSYVEKVSQINDAVDALRHAATCALFERRDVIVVATVSCIYGLGVPEAYLERALLVHARQRWASVRELAHALEQLGYRHAAPGGATVSRGEFRLRLRGAQADAPVGTPAAAAAPARGALVVELAPVAEGTSGESRRILHLELDRIDTREQPGNEGEGEGEDMCGERPAGDVGAVKGARSGANEHVQADGGGDAGGPWELTAIRAVHVRTGRAARPTKKGSAAAGQRAASAARAGDASADDGLDDKSQAEPQPNGATTRALAVLGARAAGSSPASAPAPAPAPALALSPPEDLDEAVLYPASHHVSGAGERERVVRAIADELLARVEELSAAGRTLEAERLTARVSADLAAFASGEAVRGIENYSLHLDGRRAPGEPPRTLLDYLPADDWLLLVDESHLTVAQLSAMHAGDSQRKATLIENGFRLPSAADNRPLTGDEFWAKVPQAVLVSATPGAELAMCRAAREPIVEMLIRPTGVVDPRVSVVPSAQYEDHLLAQLAVRRARGERALVTTLTKRSAEALADFLNARGVSAVHLHADVGSAARLASIERLRDGTHDVLVGCNLLREGLDLPMVSLVAIVDADKMGFLRSATSLVQTIGRAARHVRGEAILYSEGGRLSDAMREAIDETDRRRRVQLAYNERHGRAPVPLRTPTADGVSDAPSPVDVERAKLLASLNGGRRARAGLDAPLPPGGALEGRARERYDAIRAWRDAAARGAQVRPFKVLTEATMLALAAQAPVPSTIEALLDVKGIGPVKAGRFGEQLLLVLADDARRAAAEAGPEPPPPAGAQAGALAGGADAEPSSGRPNGSGVRTTTASASSSVTS
ncbi:hypothetical protein KFE25_001158 [Diacronema lutheri]|uniref:DNA helicase n=1 Tax=Diacronema lutheri TaxID=2081491 RepID=A0A8J5XJA7_DIALT|nr:hypothetical protein KFE25_001158 [Diacronema lutheri]